ncbi:hypothetical protein H4R33_000641 [Dimargaris cristalligena]|uniref:Uncharacterized protein n=1 Tax=Dimargaris cristalligena TaxID=215637 RepID=A0A4Q0A2R4_9FUNG|nr:hypothetical protein H4R33_000641 [Dimargaris cristalligena]RKP39821.1 hypothetical protein BJ085DRAFT_38297 [Dimargaris cristalligena]|eukprot:RKP39821.1 hypothetical protein BJ085DRAFT_38297 [Dimargaris cristalligena]
MIPLVYANLVKGALLHWLTRLRRWPDRVLAAFLRWATFRRIFATWLILVSVMTLTTLVVQRIRAHMRYLRAQSALRLQLVTGLLELLNDHRLAIGHINPTTTGVALGDLTAVADLTLAIKPRFLTVLDHHHDDGNHTTTTSLLEGPSGTDSPMASGSAVMLEGGLLPPSEVEATAVAAAAGALPAGDSLQMATLRLSTLSERLRIQLEEKSLANQPPQDYDLIILKRKVSQTKGDLAFSLGKTDLVSPYTSPYFYSPYSTSPYADTNDAYVKIQSELRTLKGLLLNPKFAFD